MIRLRQTFLAACALGSVAVSAPAFAQCTVPNVLTNGGVADATEVMDNFNAVADCADDVDDAAVKQTGTPASGELVVFSGDKTITGGDLSGDVSTSGGTVTALAETGVTAGTYTNADISVDAKGRVTAAANGASGGGGSSASGAVLTLSASQTISTNTDTVLTWSSAVKDDFSLWDGSGDVTVPSAGWYMITLNVEWDNAGSTNVFKYSSINVNSSNSSGKARSLNTNEVSPSQSTVTVEYLTAGDIVRGVVRHTQGSNYNVTKARLSVVKVG